MQAINIHPEFIDFNIKIRKYLSSQFDSVYSISNSYVVLQSLRRFCFVCYLSITALLNLSVVIIRNISGRIVSIPIAVFLRRDVSLANGSLVWDKLNFG